MTDKSRADAFVFFGATGDLVYKEIFPALQGLVKAGMAAMPLIGVARSPWTTDQLRARARSSLEDKGNFDPVAFEKLAGQLQYVSGDYGDPQTHVRIRQALGDAQRPVFYMAVPPSVFPVVTDALSCTGCSQGARVVVEKPFGRDLVSAQRLNETLHKHFPEESIFRIDHFLGKEAVQNIPYTRFANPILEPIWNGDHVRSIQITMAEDFGVKDRGGFYEEAGAIRDVVQNHLLEVLTIVTMDLPGSEPDGYRSAKVKLLRAVRSLEAHNVVRGQYRRYRSAKGVAPDSTVETYAALKLTIDNRRWAGVPVYIRTGKELAVTATEVFVQFKRPQREAFAEVVPPESCHLRMRIGPDIDIGLGLRVKVPGEKMVGNDVELTLTALPAPGDPPYQRLFSEVIRGNTELFARQDGVEESWRIVDDVLRENTPFYFYEPGSWGPEEADRLIGEDGPWTNPTVPRRSWAACQEGGD
jgi:glucose-6-phosphate 1-dehydrogenase